MPILHLERRTERSGLENENMPKANVIVSNFETKPEIL